MLKLKVSLLRLYIRSTLYWNLSTSFIETVTTQRFNEITFVSSSSTLLHVSAFYEAIIK
jgi:hypothetical protein